MDDIDNLAYFISNVVRQAMMISPQQAREVLDKLSLAESVMPIFDPTRYLNERDDLHNNKRLFEIFVRFRNELETLANEIAEREGISLGFDRGR